MRWPTLLEASQITRTAGFLARVVLDAGLELGETGERLREEVERVAVQASLTLLTAARAQACLETAGVISLALKGLAFQAHDPAHLVRRHFDDVDLLVRAADLPAAGAALRGAGFTADALLPDYGGAALDGGAVSPALHRTANFQGPARTLLELHTTLPTCQGPDATFEALVSRSVLVEHPDGRLRLPCREDALGMLCRHVVVQHSADCGHLPRHVADVAALLAAGADPALTAARYDADGRGSVAWSLALLDAARRGHGRAARAWSWIWGPLDALRVRLVEYRGAAGLGMIFPSRRYMAQRYGVAPASPLLPLLYAWRPVRGVVKLLTGR
ncbi:MAG: nucleotidyltransferase family protein [Anaeromyxobacter sp.]|nr:nucleotidyltransferase family protein [Anaeromyxobacter sp.]MBL0278065.1 nucleotidyltransferase family protein [Anaeromyxobacter sp.]